MNALLFVPVAIAISLTPGPNNFCGLNNGIRAGVGAALVATVGRVAAFAIFLCISAVGLGAMLLGAVLVLLGGVLWGINATVSKLLMADYHADPLWIACVRELAAGALFLACAGVRTPKLLAGAVRDRRSYPMLLLAALTCVLFVQVSYLSAIDWTNSGTATVLQTLNLLFVLACLLLRLFARGLAKVLQAALRVLVLFFQRLAMAFAFLQSRLQVGTGLLAARQGLFSIAPAGLALCVLRLFFRQGSGAGLVLRLPMLGLRLRLLQSLGVLLLQLRAGGLVRLRLGLPGHQRLQIAMRALLGVQAQRLRQQQGQQRQAQHLQAIGLEPVENHRQALHQNQHMAKKIGFMAGPSRRSRRHPHARRQTGQPRPVAPGPRPLPQAPS